MPTAQHLVLQIEQAFHRYFIPRLQATVKAEVKRAKSDASGTGAIAVSATAPEDGGAGAANVPDSVRAKKSEKQDEDENEEDNEEYNEGKLRFAGRRTSKCWDELHAGGTGREDWSLMH